MCEIKHWRGFPTFRRADSGNLRKAEISIPESLRYLWTAHRFSCREPHRKTRDLPQGAPKLQRRSRDSSDPSVVRPPIGDVVRDGDIGENPPWAGRHHYDAIRESDRLVQSWVINNTVRRSVPHRSSSTSTIAVWSAHRGRRTVRPSITARIRPRTFVRERRVGASHARAPLVSVLKSASPPFPKNTCTFETNVPISAAKFATSMALASADRMEIDNRELTCRRFRGVQPSARAGDLNRAMLQINHPASGLAASSFRNARPTNDTNSPTDV